MAMLAPLGYYVELEHMVTVGDDDHTAYRRGGEQCFARIERGESGERNRASHDGGVLDHRHKPRADDCLINGRVCN